MQAHAHIAYTVGYYSKIWTGVGEISFAGKYKCFMYDTKMLYTNKNVYYLY